MNPNQWSTVLPFCAIATLLSVSYGWLVKNRKLALNPVMAFSDAQVQFIKVWAKLAAAIGIILPLVMWIVFWHQPVARVFFGCYLFTVVVQLFSETIFSRILCKSVVVMIGTLYTGFRIWQLWLGLHLIAYSQPWLTLLWLDLLFWIANMIMLTVMAIPSLFPRSNYSLSEEKVN